MLNLFVKQTAKATFLFISLFIAGFLNSLAQTNTWTQKADFGGGYRNGAVGFSIGNKGYLGMGNSGSYYYKDFWEYDPVANTWVQKADFGGGRRIEAVGFSIGNKGYLGTGYFYKNGAGNGTYNKDFWEYDPVANIWTRKADFGGDPRAGAVGFSIGSKGYLGTGFYGTGNETIIYKDFWEYNPAANIWVQKEDFGGDARIRAVSFSLGSKGYVGTGGFGDYFYKDFWEYNPADNSWVQKGDFEGTARYGATGFIIGNKGYLGMGYFYKNGAGNGIYFKDFWGYDPVVDSWTRKADFGGGDRFRAVGFSISNKGYLGTGFYGTGTTGYDSKDFWEYTPDGTTCPVPANLSVTNITASSAKLKWDTAAGAEAYRLRYKPLHSDDWVNKATPETSEKITGLLPGTAYRWEVKTFCHKDPPQVGSDGSAKGEFTTAALSISDEAVQQVLFQIYPVPAKDILHIQTNGSATFSLVNQVGKILATKNINGNGSINVAGIAAGLYYLKNNSTGAVQKVVIAR